MSESEPKDYQSAALIILGEDLEPSDVSQALGLIPSQAWRKGEQKSIISPVDGQRRFFDSNYDYGGWKLWLDEELRNQELCDQFSHWASVLRPKAAELHDLRERGADIELNCYLSTSSVVTVEVDHVLLAELGSLGIDLSIGFFS